MPRMMGPPDFLFVFFSFIMFSIENKTYPTKKTKRPDRKPKKDMAEITNKTRTWMYLFCLSLAEIGADFALKRYVQYDNPDYLVQGSLGYIFVVLFLLLSLRAAPSVLYVNAMWDGLSALLESGAAYVLLGERFENPRQYVGVALIVLGLFLVQ